jgi:hypothetical protein
MPPEMRCNLCKEKIDDRHVPDYFKGRICADCWQQIEKEVSEEKKNTDPS